MLHDSGSQLPHRWVSGDDEMGRLYWFRRRLASLGERYLLAVPGNTLMRDLSSPPPAYRGRGRRPTRPGWHHHQTLSLIATWFLVRETDRGKTMDAGHHLTSTLPEIREGIALIFHQASQGGTEARVLHEREKRLQRNELAHLYH